MALGRTPHSGTSVNCKSRCKASACRTEGKKKKHCTGAATLEKKKLGAPAQWAGKHAFKRHARKHRLSWTTAVLCWCNTLRYRANIPQEKKNYIERNSGQYFLHYTLSKLEWPPTPWQRQIRAKKFWASSCHKWKAGLPLEVVWRKTRKMTHATCSIGMKSAKDRSAIAWSDNLQVGTRLGSTKKARALLIAQSHFGPSSHQDSPHLGEAQALALKRSNCPLLTADWTHNKPPHLSASHNKRWRLVGTWPSITLGQEHYARAVRWDRTTLTGTQH